MDFYIDTETANYPLTEWDIKNMFPEVSWAIVNFVAPDRFKIVSLVDRPSVNPQLETVKEGRPELYAMRWRQTWVITPIDPAVIAQNAAEKESNRIASLWENAHEYEYRQISGSAVGLLAMGVLTGKPKCTAVQNWIKGIWELYYTRKFGTSTDCDYSSCGEIPYTVPELMAEMGV